MNEEEFLLKWNNHQNNFIDVFRELLRNDSFVDVTLVCSGQPISGHKVVLAACSPLLHRILHDNPCKHPVIILSDVRSKDMRAVMRFIYQGEVSVSQSELASFLRTADNLQIKGLAEDREKDDKKRKLNSKEDENTDSKRATSSAKRQKNNIINTFSTNYSGNVSTNYNSKSQKDSHSSSSHKKHIHVIESSNSSTSSSPLVPTKSLNIPNNSVKCDLETQLNFSIRNNDKGIKEEVTEKLVSIINLFKFI